MLGRAGLTGLLISAGVVATVGPASAWFFPRRETPRPPPCVLDNCLGNSPDPSPARRVPGAVGSGFDFYVLALSWSPGFCSAAGAGRSPSQCAKGRDLGFVVHGLWPQNTSGYPSDCDTGVSRSPPRAAIDGVSDLYPDPGLARHEWRRHGTCSGLSPTAYFAAVRQARAAVTIPPQLDAPHDAQQLAPLEITRAFLAANPGLQRDAMTVTCRSGMLAEVRICLTRDLRGFQSCPEVARDACRTRSLTVPPPG